MSTIQGKKQINSIMVFDRYNRLISVCSVVQNMKVSGNVTYYLECRMKELHDRIKMLNQYIESNLRHNDDYHNEIAVLKVHYTSLLNTALAYENFDQEDFESKLS